MNYNPGRLGASSLGTVRRPGRPKLPWHSLDDELAHRLAEGNSATTIIDEARVLESWASVFLRFPDERGRKRVRTPSLSAIRQRISRYFGGASGYRDAREAACNKRRLSPM